MKKAKKILAAAMVLLAASSFVFTSCDPEVPENNNTEQTGGDNSGGESTDKDSGSTDETPATKEYTVTFDKADGSESPKSTAKVKDGEKAEKPADPTKTGYTFAGWFAKDAAEAFDFESTISADTTLTAKWTVVEYTITYTLGEGETNAESNPAKYTIESDDITLAAPTGTTAKPNFVAWHKDKADGETVTSIKKGSTGNITLVAEFTDKTTFKVTYYNGTKELDSVSVVEGGAVENKTIDVEGYDFDGWYSDTACTTAFDFTNTKVTAAVSVYGKYVKSDIKFSVIPTEDKPFVISYVKNDNVAFAEINGCGADETKYVKDDKVIITVKGKAYKDIKGMKIAFIDCAADTVVGSVTTYGYNVMAEKLVDAEDSVITANTDFEKTIELSIEKDQIGTGAEAHRVRIICDSTETIKIYPQGTDTEAKLAADIAAEEEAKADGNLVTPTELTWGGFLTIEGTNFTNITGKALKITGEGEEFKIKLEEPDWSHNQYASGKMKGGVWSSKDSENQYSIEGSVSNNISVIIYVPTVAEWTTIKTKGFGIRGIGKVTKVQIVDAPSDGVEHAADDSNDPELTASENLLEEDLVLDSWGVQKKFEGGFTGNNDAKKIEVTYELIDAGYHSVKISTWVAPDWSEAPVSGTPSIDRGDDGAYSITSAGTLILILDADGTNVCKYGDVQFYGFGIKITSIKYYY